MNQHNFLLSNVDTDAISVCKADMSEFSDEEIEALTKELNSLFPEHISWEDDGYYPFFGVLKAKNYIMYDGKKISTKGSGLKDQKKEVILRKMLDDMIVDLVHNYGNKIPGIYMTCIREALHPSDIKTWSQKKTITKAILDCEKNPLARKNERDVYDAIAGKGFQEGDKVYVYPVILSEDRVDTTLKNGKVRTKITKVTGLRLFNEHKNDHDPEKLLDRVYATVKILTNVIDKDLFIDYTASKNKHLLVDL